ncbi:uncharacterized protein LOC116028949 [Ipomoea triloba]|uniref:uncharacterized protein LOC116028949 n=1 Tax=Ipomoea triloba TaxID=35885 RepID=UPI00125D7116|nr:uncharacterized protein LOC116028949 [Ipomoea triloba]
MPRPNESEETFEDWVYPESRAQNRISKKALEFYERNYGFKRPLNVLCSSSFLKKWRSAGEIEKRLLSVLGKKAVVWATNCVLQELGGGGYEGKVYSCDHQSTTGKSCLHQIAKQESSKHLFATDNTYFGKTLLKLAGVPVILLQRRALMLKKPSGAQRAFAKERKAARMAEAEAQPKEG